MKKTRIICAVAMSVLFLGQASLARAVEIQVLCSNGLKAVMEDLAPKFERATGHKIVVKYGLAANFKQAIESGQTFDAAFLTPAAIDDLIKQGKVAADSRAVIARAGLGLMIRAGAKKPDVRTTDAFKKALQGANGIAYAKEGASGVAFVAIIEKLGMAESLKSKLKPTVTGAELGGVFPSEEQSYIVMAAGTSPRAKQSAAARELIKFRTSPDALPV